MDAATLFVLGTLVVGAVALVPSLLRAIPAVCGRVNGLIRRAAGPRLSALLAISALALPARITTADAAVPPPAHRLADPQPGPDEPDDGRVDTGPFGVSIGSRRYVVEPGDSLWAIACRALRAASGADPSNREIDALWRRIYADNVEVVGSNPDLIFPGQVLRIPEGA